MISNQSSLLYESVNIFAILIRSFVLIKSHLLLQLIVQHIPMLFRFIKFVVLYVQVLSGFISGFHYSLVNLADDDFIYIPIDELLNENNNRDYNKPDTEDIFHIYLSKILYEADAQIREQCTIWHFKLETIKILTSIESTDCGNYPSSMKVAVIHHKQSNRIVIGFGGTEPMECLKWLTIAPTNLIDIPNVFNDEHIQVHGGFYFALGLSEFNPSKSIDFNNINAQTPMFIQIINAIEKIRQNDNKYQISITGHSLNGGLASLFTFVLLSYGYESSISGLYTYGQPLVGNYHFAKILNMKLGNRIHRWVNNNDIITHIPVIQLPSTASSDGRTPYSDALIVVAANNNRIRFNEINRDYFHSGLKFKIDQQGNLIKQNLTSEKSTDESNNLFHIKYSIVNSIHSLFNITPFRSILWLIVPAEINDHFPGDYARRIKKIVNRINE